jgi:hypothetical protein
LPPLPPPLPFELDRFDVGFAYQPAPRPEPAPRPTRFATSRDAGDMYEQARELIDSGR